MMKDEPREPNGAVRRRSQGLWLIASAVVGTWVLAGFVLREQIATCTPSTIGWVALLASAGFALLWFPFYQLSLSFQTDGVRHMTLHGRQLVPWDDFTRLDVRGGSLGLLHGSKRINVSLSYVADREELGALLKSRLPATVVSEAVSERIL